MKKFMFGLMAAVTLLFGVGCGGNACDDLEDANKALNDKVAACGDDTGGDEDVFNKGVCEDALDACSDSDKDRLSDLADCIQDLPDCQVGSEVDWINQFSECFNRTEGISASCAAAAGG
ncbi:MULTISPECIES: hypothetical protein [Myxococcus]|uniref:hypothetical protein n=1 Tax=Myxococcus TaxID=32 RepID=UPI0013D07BB2|nr:MULTISPECIES: hypothetical protein [Myxococcus]NVJ27697.1 hypothetical protein [Myxococcus sp. AM011]